MPEPYGGSSAQQGSTDDHFRQSPPQLALPKGGGAIRGIGEKFSANPVTGTGSLSVPIFTSPGRSGFGPQLSLSYDSGAGNSPFGFGWHLALPSITRKTDKGLPQYRDGEESDAFILSGAEDLVPVLLDSGGQWQRETSERTVDGVAYSIQPYRPRIEGLFARLERWTNQADPGKTCWRSISKDNITTWYGKTKESRIVDPDDPTRIFSWLTCESYDDKGNALLYEYKEENTDGVDLRQAHERNRTAQTRAVNRYVKRIKYGNRRPYFPTLAADQPPTPLPAEWLFEVVFDYGEHHAEAPTPHDPGLWPCRREPFSSYRAGFEVRTYRLCQRVLMFHHFPNEPGVGANCLVRSTDFTYSEVDPTHAQNPVFAFLLSVTHTGYKSTSAGEYLAKSLPPVEFTYSQPVISADVREVESASLEQLPSGLDGARVQWVDLDGEGLSGMLTEQGSAWYYTRNLSPVSVRDNGGVPTTTARFGPLEPVAQQPSLGALSSGRQQLLDLAGDGQLDVVELDGPTPGFFERTQDAGWESLQPFASLPVLDWSNPNLRFVDLTGDGHADILISEDDVFCWYPSRAEAGFGPPQTVLQALDEEQGARVIFADRTQSIYLADMSGDGLTDLVRLRNGEVCYWPNLGYGRFGAKVTMDNVPWFDRPDAFDQQRIRLADIDGSGVTDILYLAGDSICLYFNQSGNSWSAAQRLAAFPAVDDLSSVQVADLLGNGTACLVWSSPLPADSAQPMRYVDLMGGQKPHLLIKSVNNLGAETHMHYAPSTRFYLQDRLAGKPWITRMPFPVHVVERVETYDRISGNRFVTCYAYHHAYFDGIEREFRGFGMVEQWDTEEYAALSSGQQFPTGTNIDESSHVPPVLTRTWFHTGVCLGRDHVSNFFAGLLDAHDKGEYYREPCLSDAQARNLLLEDTVLPAGLPVDEEREACRALKGAMLRQEVYALDGTEKAPHPYTITEQNFTIRLLQPRAGNRHAVFFTHAREAISYHYERNPADPRITHALTLEVDDYGNVRKSAAIGYGRRQPDTSLPPEDQAKQTQILNTYTENGFTNPIAQDDNYRTPLPSESRTYELTGLTLHASENRFGFESVLSAGAQAATLAYEEQPVAAQLQKRLIEQVRTLYRPNDLGGTPDDPLALLPLGKVESLALPGESYKLALTPGLLAQVYGGKVSNAMLETEGRYVHSEGDTNWWLRAGRIFLSPSTDDSAAAELAFAREHFFVPHRFRDPFHAPGFETESFVSMDVYDLLPVETRDALGNVVATVNDYRLLQPSLLTDPNGNRSAVAFDTLGLVVGTAVMGKPGEHLGDELLGFEPDLDEAVIQAHLAAPLADPHAILQRAANRLVYDLLAYQRTQSLAQPEPTVVYALARETHAWDLKPGERTKIQHSFTYSDGFGREIQKKIQAEPGPVPKRDPATGQIIVVDGQPEMTTEDVQPRWVGSGWAVFNNKGKPVRQFERFFTDTHSFESDVRIGISPILCYDPVERVVATLHPNDTYEKVIFDPWQQETWDVNDTVLLNPRTDADVRGFTEKYFAAVDDPPGSWQTWYAQRAAGGKGSQEQDAANKAAAHAGTWTVAHFDMLGRPFLTIADNGAAGKYETRIELDIEGNQRDVIDALDRVVMHYDYDILGSQIHSRSMDAGERWMLNDVAGQPIRVWDGRGHEFRTEYDQLHRPVRQFVRGTDAAHSDPRVLNREVLFQKTEYGEGQADDVALNLRTRVFKQYDSSGVVTSLGRNPVTNNDEAYDFKGNLLRGTRQLAADYKSVPDWADPVALEPEVFSSSTTYDALNRPISLISPDNSEIKPTYNEANLLEQVGARLRGAAEWTPFVEDLDYNAKGQRELIVYGNGVETTYYYDPLTFRLTHLKTTRNSAGDLQNLSYIYDPAGNITHIQDDAQQTLFFDNTMIEPHADYAYDAIYQLIKATGREHIGQVGQVDHNDPVIHPLPHPNHVEAMRPYTEIYEYDAVGNILKMIHQANGGSWTRRYQYAADSNRLLATSLPGDAPDGPYTGRYEYNEHGSMIHMPHLPLMAWDFAERLQASSTQVVTDGAPEMTYYVYDATGQRVRRVTERQPANGGTPTRMKERIYLGEFEFYREYGADSNSIALERETLHVMDDKQRIVMMETQTFGDDGSPARLIRYQHGNHLGSASLELDGTGQVISYEEYHPYGTTAYNATDSGIEVSLKRFRYTGKERDEETGLYYHGARYYASWLGRWSSVDPLGLDDGVNRWAYVHGNPIAATDPTGTASQDEQARLAAQRAAQQRAAEQRAAQASRASVETTRLASDVASEVVETGAVEEIAARLQESTDRLHELANDYVKTSDELIEFWNQHSTKGWDAPLYTGETKQEALDRLNRKLHSISTNFEELSTSVKTIVPGLSDETSGFSRFLNPMNWRITLLSAMQQMSASSLSLGELHEKAARLREASDKLASKAKAYEFLSSGDAEKMFLKARSVDPTLPLEMWIGVSDYVFADDLERRSAILRHAHRDQITPDDLAFMEERFGAYPVYSSNGFITAWRFNVLSFTGFAEWVKERVRIFGALTDPNPKPLSTLDTA